MTTMRAILVDEPGPPEAMRLAAVPRPEPAAGEARLRVAYVGMNPVDAMARRQKLAWMPVRWPFTPGLEHTGVVDAVGPGVDAAWLGRRVLSRASFGGYADWSIAPVDLLLPVPDGISLRDGCVYRGASFTAWHALFKVARVQAGERVLVHSAAGPVGLMALQIARDAGATVVGLCSGSKRDWVRSFGIERVVDYRIDGWPERAREAVDGAGFDVILDGNGGPDALKNYDLIAPLGRIVFLGATAGGYPPVPPVNVLIAKSCLVGGMTLRQVEDVPGGEADRTIADAVRSGKWRVPVGDEVALEDVVDLHRRLEARELRGRAVVRVGGEIVSGE